MTTTTLHANVQRSRFAHHALASIAALLRAPLKAMQGSSAKTGSPSDAAAVEAQKVRQMASSYAKTDPGFAADLYAAAARHEGLYAD